MQIPASTYGACPSLRMTIPRDGPGRAHREGPVRHEGEVSKLFGRPSTDRLPQMLAKRAVFCTEAGLPCFEAVVRSAPRAWAGTHAAAAALAVRRDRPGRACGSGSQRCDRVAQRFCAAAHDAALAAKSRAAVLELYSLDQQLAGAQIAARARCSGRRESLRARAREPRASARAIAKRGTRLAQSRLAQPASRALRAGQRRAARDRVRREDARRGDDEPRQPQPDDEPGRGRAPRVASSAAAQPRAPHRGTRTRASRRSPAATRAGARRRQPRSRGRAQPRAAPTSARSPPSAA